MKIDNDKNYTILANNVNKEFLNKFSDYKLIDSNIDYPNLANIINNSKDKVLVFNETLYNLTNFEITKISTLLKLKNMHFINITSNIEEVLLTDYIYVYDNNILVKEGDIKTVLKEEKLLKKIGYGLPFITDLSMQLHLYNIVDKVYFKEEDLREDLWN